MKIVKTDATKTLETIIDALNNIDRPCTENEVAFRYISNGFMMVDYKTWRRIQITVLTDGEGIQLEFDMANQEGYKNLVMNKLDAEQTTLAAEYTWNWLNVDEGFLMNHLNLEQRIERNSEGNIVRYRKVS